MAFLGGDVNSHNDQDVRRALHALSSMAERSGASVVILRHLNKASGGNALYRGGGSIGIVGAARAGMLVALDPADEGRRVLAMTKSNLAAMPASLAYRLLPADENPDVARVKWEGPTAHSAADLLAIPQDADERSAIDDATELLEEVLADGPVPAVEAKRRARAADVSDRTLRRARNRIGVKVRKVGAPGEEGQRWEWQLPEGGQEIPNMATPNGWAPSHSSGEVGHLRTEQL